ncbi:MAG: hypothetical protein ACLFVK_06890 [Dehalococcoidia bacterium]
MQVTIDRFPSIWDASAVAEHLRDKGFNPVISAEGDDYLLSVDEFQSIQALLEYERIKKP